MTVAGKTDNFNSQPGREAVLHSKAVKKVNIYWLTIAKNGFVITGLLDIIRAPIDLFPID